MEFILEELKIFLDSSDDIVIETDIDGVDIIESINENEGVKCI